MYEIPLIYFILKSRNSSATSCSGNILGLPRRRRVGCVSRDGCYDLLPAAWSTS